MSTFLKIYEFLISILILINFLESGSDNITFEAVVRGGSFNFGNASFRVIAQFMRPDGACDVFGHADPGIAPYPLIIFTPPAKTFSLVVTSNATVTQDVIVDYKLTRLN